MAIHVKINYISQKKLIIFPSAVSIHKLFNNCYETSQTSMTSLLRSIYFLAQLLKNDILNFFSLLIFFKFKSSSLNTSLYDYDGYTFVLITQDRPCEKWGQDERGSRNDGRGLLHGPEVHGEPGFRTRHGLHYRT